MKLRIWQEKNNYTIKDGADFLCVPKKTYEKWLYQDVVTPQQVLKMIEMHDALMAINGFCSGVKNEQ